MPFFHFFQSIGPNLAIVSRGVQSQSQSHLKHIFQKVFKITGVKLTICGVLLIDIY